MKRLTKALLKFNFAGIDLNDVDKIEFAFSQNIGEKPKKIEIYPGTNTSRIGDDSIIGVEWTAEDTALFVSDKSFYADTRITLKNISYQPSTDIIKLEMKPTLFEEGSV